MERDFFSFFYRETIARRREFFISTDNSCVRKGLESLSVFYRAFITDFCRDVASMANGDLTDRVFLRAVLGQMTAPDGSETQLRQYDAVRCETVECVGTD